MKVTFPTGKFISPGLRTFHSLRIEEEEKWWMGELIEVIQREIHETHQIEIPQPSAGCREFFHFADLEYIVVRDDDLEFWGGVTKIEWLEEIQQKNAKGILKGAGLGWWDVDENGIPQKKAICVSISEMVEQKKPLMAHLMVDLGFFSSVGQARKNGWDKPLELGRHELGPKKKRAFVEIVP